jgi:hypothetical protein
MRQRDWLAVFSGPIDAPSRLHRALHRPDVGFCLRRPLPRAAFTALDGLQLRERLDPYPARQTMTWISRHRNRAASPPTSRTQHRRPSSSCGSEHWIKPLAEVTCEALFGLDVVRASVAGSLSSSGPETSTNDIDHSSRAQADILVFSRPARPRCEPPTCRMVASVPGLRYPRAPAIGGCDSTQRPPNTEIKPAGITRATDPTNAHDAESLRHRSPPPAPR